VATLDVDGVPLEVRTIPGAAAKPWLVFLHEGLGSVSLWRDVPDVLARRLGLRALIYSRRGYGRSAPLADRVRPLEFMHQEARGVLPKLLAQTGIEEAILIGHSDGASIALIRAADAPHATRGLVALAPHVMVEDVSVASIMRLHQTYLAMPDLRARLARHHDHVDDAFLGWADVWTRPAFRSWTLDRDVARLTVPTLLIQGMQDEYGTLAQLDAIEAGAVLARIQRVVLDACGHSPHRDQREATLDAICGFVERITL
jgi:pimeloyl-ACP methyl ester carboxylesterase